MSYTLRPYQQEMAEQIWSATQTRALDTLVVLPTGGGKTKLGAKMSDFWTTAGSETWIFAHRRELIKGWSNDLTALGADHGVIAPDRPLTRHKLQVCSIDTVLARLGDLHERLAGVGRILDDECHHVVSGGRVKVHGIARRALKIGVTATPFRLDGTGLGNVYRHAVIGPTMRALIDMGSLTPAIVFEPPIKLDFSQAKMRGGDYAAADVEKVVDKEPVTQAAIDAYRKHLDGKPTIVFCASVKHAEKVAAAFARAGYRSASIDGNSKDRDELIAGLGDGRIQVLTSCDVISEGTDIPVVAGAILLRKTASTGLYLQQVGRVLRLAAGKLRAVIIDLVKNVEVHGLPDAIRKWTLAGGIKGLERAVTATRRCWHCHCRSEAILLVCPECGRPYANGTRTLVRGGRPIAPPANDAALPLPQFTDAEILSMDLAALKKLARTKPELDRIATVRGYRKGWSDQILLLRRNAARSYRRY